MEKDARRYNKVQKNKKERIIVKKGVRNTRQSNFEKLLTGYEKQRKRRDEYQIPKITSGRLTVKPGVFANSERSEVVTRDQPLNLSVHSKALLDEDLFTLIDLGKTRRLRSDKFKADLADRIDSNLDLNLNIVTQFDKSVSLQSDTKTDLQPQSKSIFKEIEDQYNSIVQNTQQTCDTNENYLIHLEDIVSLVTKKLDDRKLTVADGWSNRFKVLLSLIQIPDYEIVFLYKFKNNQRKLTRQSVLIELANRYSGVNVTNSCLKRNFVKRFNALISAQGLRTRSITYSVVGDIQAMMHECQRDQPPTPTPTPLSHTAPSTTQPQAQPRPHTPPAQFSAESYQTPPNQKFVYRAPETSPKLQTAVYVPSEARAQPSGANNHLFVHVYSKQPLQNCSLVYEFNANNANHFKFSPVYRKHATSAYRPRGNDIVFSESSDFVPLSRPKKMSKFEKPEKPSTIKHKPVTPMQQQPNKENSSSKLDSRRKLNFIGDGEYSNMAMAGANNNVAIRKPLYEIDNNMTACSSSHKYYELENMDVVPIDYSPTMTDFVKPTFTSSEYKSRKTLTPNEFKLRKRYAPETLTSEMERNMSKLMKNDLDEYPKSPSPPDPNYHPRVFY